MDTEKLPLITVITPLYNSVQCLENTIISVINQNYPKIEYIVVDGGSKDGSLEIINKYRDRISVVLSEPDKGAYDAINKGIRLAKGEWINIMNAGDWFINDDVVEKVHKYLKGDQGDIFYGDTESRALRNRVISALPDNQIGNYWKIGRICAQSVFMKSDLAKKYEFNLNYPIQSYFDFMLKCISFNYKFKKVPLVVSSYMGGGMSDQNPVRETISRWGICLKYNNSFGVHFHFTYRVIRSNLLNIYRKFFAKDEKVYL